MTDWITQHNDYSCGPVAIANVMKWADIEEFEGHKVNNNLVDYLTQMCSTDHEGTVAIVQFIVLCSIPGLVVENIQSPTISDIKKCIASGGIVNPICNTAYNARKEKPNWHTFLIIDQLIDYKFYRVINYLSDAYDTLLADTTLHRFTRRIGTEANFIWK